MLRVLRSLALLAPITSAACERTPTTQSVDPPRNTAGSSTSSTELTAADAAQEQVVEDSGLAQQDPTQTTESSRYVTSGERCASPGERRSALAPNGEMRCACTGDASAARWACDPGSMRMMGPLPPPDLEI